MARRSQYSFATRAAESLVRDELEITKLHIDPVKIAQDRGIIVEAMPDTHDGVSGMLIKAQDNFIIAFATHIKSNGFQRFSIAHEVGHYFLEGHVDALLPPGTERHRSHSGFVSTDRYELEADHFAAGLLMPEYLFRPAMAKAGEGLDAVEELRRQCGTSLTATAIRFQELTDEAFAVIQCNENRIEFCCMSDRMLSLHPGRWPKKGDLVPDGTTAARLHADKARILASERINDETDGSRWFGLFDDVELFEETVGLGRYGRTLTILTTVDALPDDQSDDDDDASWNRRIR